MIANILVNTIGALIFLFIFWKKLREDHVSEIIFSSASIIFFGVLISYFVSLRFFPEWFFWIQFLVGLIGFFVAVVRFKMKGYEVFDAAVISSLPWLSFFYLKDAIVNSLFTSFVAFVVILVLICIYYLLDSNYKSFAWYKSGRIGLAGLSTLSIFFLIRAAIATQIPTVLSLVVKYDPYISGSLAFLGFLLIFNLTRKTD